MATGNEILLAFYGDDFTGSTDALEFICRAGAKAILFLEPPTNDQLNKYPSINAFGIAGKTRSLPVEEMEKILITAFEQIRSVNPRHAHYKVCSTFDSSALIGSIGKAIDCGAAVFKTKTIPVLGGMPALGRFCVFGNLFARMGTGSAGSVYRLDRHPSMSKHPVTAADESDLRLHLGRQTDKRIGLIDIKQLNDAVESIHSNEEVAVIDTLHEEDLQKIGEWVDKLYQQIPIFSVGSSGIELALGKYWNETGILKQEHNYQQLNRADPLLIVSGSCSPVTASQIRWAKLNGFEELVIDSFQISKSGALQQTLLDQITGILATQKDLLIHTGEKQSSNLSSEKLGTALGQIALYAAQKKLVKRIVVAGGDTSSYAARAMEIEAVEMIAALIPGAPVCRAISSNTAMNGMEVNFKGGQVGGEDYFGILKEGKLS